ncbi:hypothetical protein GCM10009841_12150 [Microlunatus panaciterrae]|uniref:Coenzyme F420-0:L-glutamate ligase/coenzyme F420-1:gamma-L-glutamate ligase n=1 Tax=Microlunatus panaciterrae TaxID=400768 RepID=A0ABS2RNM1_9ACTN|nr:coenzyme F420-0:L-glutamate ligase [Microlunatus panaciterrae]MBM7799771.1 coenzyme F420-0:L-glutamate ligase/coenzyme F420-1:gamma-L-glutamate ligase [Microlunatus panaciterrae]
MTPSALLTVFAPDGIGEVTATTDLAGAVVAAIASDPQGPLTDGDIVVVTSKVVSKSEGRTRPADERQQAISEEAVRVVAQRGETRIVQTRHGLTMAAAGVDNSNVPTGEILLLPVDPDASAARLRSELTGRTGARVGVVISDTAGRAWRVGQTDIAIGAAGLCVIDHYAGRQDGYGNELQVTSIAIADELAAAADLAKGKLDGRPVAVVRGLGRFVADADDCQPGAAALIRPAAGDMFRTGSREAVVLAVLTALGRPERYAEVIAIDDPTERAAAALDGAGPDGTTLPAAQAELLTAVLQGGSG